MLIESARKVLADFTAALIDKRTGKIIGDAWTKKDGIILDATTANAVCTVYDALSEKNQKKLEAMLPLQAVDIVWKLIKTS